MDDLYNLIDGGDDYVDLLQIQGESNEKQDKYIWNCIIDCAIYTCKIVYKFYDAGIPEPLEDITAEVYEDSRKCYEKLKINCKDEIIELEMYFISNYPKGTEKEINISEIKKIFK